MSPGIQNQKKTRASTGPLPIKRRAAEQCRRRSCAPRAANGNHRNSVGVLFAVRLLRHGETTTSRQPRPKRTTQLRLQRQQQQRQGSCTPQPPGPGRRDDQRILNEIFIRNAAPRQRRACAIMRVCRLRLLANRTAWAALRGSIETVSPPCARGGLSTEVRTYSEHHQHHSCFFFCLPPTRTMLFPTTSTRI